MGVYYLLGILLTDSILTGLYLGVLEMEIDHGKNGNRPWDTPIKVVVVGFLECASIVSSICMKT